MKSKILLTGSSGKLGSAIMNSGLFDGLLCPSETALDIRNENSIKEYFENNDFDTIIHCAAMARIKECQKVPELAIETNIIGTSNLVIETIKKERTTEKSIRFIQISTDGVYQGTKGNYKEEDPTIPFSTYGWTKLGAECSVMSLKNFCIMRTSFFDPENIQFNDSPTDVYSSKLGIKELVKAIKRITEHKFNGVINVGGQKMSEYERYSKHKPGLKKCLWKDVQKGLDFIFPKDASMNCEKWNKINKEK